MISDLLVAAIAFTAGNLVGWFARAVWQTRALTKEIDAKMDDLSNKMDERGALALDRVRDLIIVLMLGVVLWSAWQSIGTNERVEEQTRERAESLECLSTWATEFGIALDVRTSRSGAITEARDQMDAAAAAVFAAVPPLFRESAGPADAQRLRDALDRHSKAYARLADLVEKSGATQAANPYPEPPRTCYG